MKLLPFWKFLLPGLLAVAGTLSAQTAIESDSLEMQGGEDRNEFLFSGNVRVESEQLRMLTDRLLVLARREARPDATVGKIGAIESIIATGNVEIHQGGRVAYAGKAEVFPDTGLLVLSDSPRIVDENAVIEGWQIVLDRDNRTARVVPQPATDGQPGQRSRVVLDDQAIPSLDYDQLQQPTIPQLNKGESQQNQDSVPAEGTRK